MLDPQRLRIFRAVTATGSMRQAASNLGYTPSAVSQHVAALQRETGLQLIERAGRGIRPTAAGRAVAESAEQVLVQLAETEATVRRLRQGDLGTLSIQHFVSVGAAWMPQVVATLTREFPDLQLDLRLAEQAGGHTSTPDIEMLVASADTSAARGYDLHGLLDEPFVVVVPAGHPLATQPRISLRDLADEPWVDNDPIAGPCRQLVLDACASVGVTPRFQIEAHDYTTAMAFVAAGVGITVLPRLAYGSGPRPGLVAVELTDPVVTRHLAVQVRSTLSRNVAVRRTLELLREQAARTA
jgi:DNA-binding transcriptional LysR family regulator